MAALGDPGLAARIIDPTVAFGARSPAG